MRIGSILILFLTIAFIASGCERVSISKSSTPEPSGEPEESTPALTSTPELTPTPVDPVGVLESDLRGVEIEIWHAWGSPQQELFEAQIAEFNRRNPWHIVAGSRIFNDWTSLYEAVNQAVEADDLPELVVTLPEHALEWDEQDLVVDLTKYLAHLKWGMTAEDIDDIPLAFWDQDQVGEKRLGVPAERSTRMLFYNARWARELGFESAPRNEDEFREQACAANGQFRSDSILSNDGYGGWIVDSDPQSALSWLLAFGGGAVNKNEYDFVSDRNETALTFLKELFDDSCAWIYTGQDAYAPLADRTALFVAGNLTELADQDNAFSIAKSSDDWTVIPFPGARGRSIPAYGPSFSVMKDSPEKQLAAWLFARWMLKPEIQTQWVKSTGMLPLRKSSLISLVSYAGSHPQWAEAVSQLDLADIQPQLASWRSVKYVLGDGLYSLFRLNLPVDEIRSVLEQMQATAEELSQ